MAPDWFGSPQHFVAGIVLAGVVALAVRSWLKKPWLLYVFAVGVTAVAEIAVEVVEYPLLYGGEIDAQAYYDTIADLAITMVGALVGAAVALVLTRRIN